ncbi:hypothetical protein GF420_12945, partial [candidate division GN15 bacterium]|nr:hypothetical protein [candidate division GN15 bacterium]
MMRSLVRSAVLLLVFATTGFSQISFDFTGAGSRARAMGGAFIGVSDDVTAGSWNPAGLWVHEGPKFGAGYGTFLPRGEAEGNLSVADQSGSWNKFHTLNFLAPVRIRGQQFVGSVSYSRIFEDYQTLSANLSGTYLRPGGGTAAFSETLTSESHFEPRSLTFALGTRVSEKISIGASADIYLGKAVSETRQNITWQDYPDFDSPQTAVRSQDVLVLDTTTFSGFGLTGGIMYNADQFNIGLLVRAPFSFESTTDQKFFTLTSYAGLAQPDQSDTTFLDNQLLKYDLPIMFALGFSYNLSENLMWAFDAEYRGFEGRD